MPVKVLFIENDSIQQASFKSILDKNLGIKHHIIDGFDSLESELKKDNYTHLISKFSINNNTINDYKHLIEIPTLIILENNIDISDTGFSYTKLPLSYSKLFAFLCEAPIISNNTLEKYAMGDQDFMNQMKGHIIEEFKANFEEIPKLLENKNLKEIKSKAHQMISKFSLLEMNNSYNLSKEIDLNIFDDPENQIQNMQQLLVDIEIALTQLK